jgi:hypothetical protein
MIIFYKNLSLFFPHFLFHELNCKVHFFSLKFCALTKKLDSSASTAIVVSSGEIYYSALYMRVRTYACYLYQPSGQCSQKKYHSSCACARLRKRFVLLVPLIFGFSILGMKILPFDYKSANSLKRCSQGSYRPWPEMRMHCCRVLMVSAIMRSRLCTYTNPMRRAACIT